MTLDPRFIVTSDIDTYYVDKDTLGPLAGGIVTFYSDNNRTMLKPIYQLTGSPPYSVSSYVALPNPIFLNGDGTFSDNNGNNIVPYYFPFVGTPDENNNTIELYYITVESATFVPQLTRQAWPNFTAQDFSQQEITNFVPNGQFLLHNNNGSQAIDTVTEDDRKRYQIAQGGWTFEIPIDSASVNDVIFESFNAFVTTPTGSPQFSCRVECLTPDAGDTFKDLCLQFNDVNKFSSNTNEYTYYFEATSNSGLAINVDLYIRKNYGLNGSLSEEIFVSTITIDNTYGPHSTSFSFGANTGKTIGLGSFVQLILRAPPTAASDISYTNFVLTQNSVVIESFPVTTDQEFVTNSLGTLPTPDPNGYDLYLPLRYGPGGYYFDQSEIGDIVSKTTNNFTNSISNTGNELLADGKQYLTTDYSPLGIPYARLQQKLFIDNSSFVGPRYGTGIDFVTINILNSTNTISLAINEEGPVSTRTADFNTTFTITPITTVTNSSPYVSYINGTNSFIITSKVLQSISVVSNPTASVGSNFTIFQFARSLTTKLSAIFTLSSIPAASSYITFNDVTNNDLYYVWFTVNGTGTDPALSANGIKVDLLSTDSVSSICTMVSYACSAKQMDRINTGGSDGSAIIQSSYFTFVANSVKYYAWMDVDNGGMDPNPGGTGIKVAISSIDSPLEVMRDISRAINSVYFATPDLRGMFLRGIDNGAVIDVDSASRFNLTGYYDVGGIGSEQIDSFSDHLHTITNLSGTNPAVVQVFITAVSGGAGSIAAINTENTVLTSTFDDGIATIPANTINISSNGSTDLTGYHQNTPVNSAVNFAIKY